MGLITEFFLEAFANPTRIGCPEVIVLETLSRGRLPIHHPVYFHIGSCSECFAEFRYNLFELKVKGDSIEGTSSEPDKLAPLSSNTGGRYETLSDYEHQSHSSDRPRFMSSSCWQRALYYTCTRKALEYVRDSLTQKLTLVEIAAAACMERTAFSKKFKQRTGISVHEFVRTYRISKAAEQMEISDYSITEIALNVGFNNLETFERAFRRVTDLSPSTYRKEMMRKKGLH